MKNVLSRTFLGLRWEILLHKRHIKNAVCMVNHVWKCLVLVYSNILGRNLGRIILNGFHCSSDAADQLVWFLLPAD